MTVLLRRSFSILLILAMILIAEPSHAQQGSPQGVGQNYETRLSTLEDTVRAMNGQIEQLEFSVRRLDQSLQRMQGDYDNRLSHLEATQASLTSALANMPPPQAQQPVQPVVQPQPQPTAAQTSSVADSNINPNGSLGAVKVQDGRVTGGINNPKAPPLPDKPADYGLTTEEQYERAFGLLRQADYDNAEKAFKAFIDKNPKDKLIDNAKYWYGETLYVRGRFDESAVAFADAYQQNPQGNKAPDSLLKLAMSLSAIDKVPDACTTLAELKTKYPNAAANVRSRADEERQKLKCGAH